jgi:hypothetical protein
VFCWTAGMDLAKLQVPSLSFAILRFLLLLKVMAIEISNLTCTFEWFWYSVRPCANLQVGPTTKHTSSPESSKPRTSPTVYLCGQCVAWSRGRWEHYVNLVAVSANGRNKVLTTSLLSRQGCLITLCNPNSSPTAPNHFNTARAQLKLGY